MGVNSENGFFVKKYFFNLINAHGVSTEKNLIDALMGLY